MQSGLESRRCRPERLLISRDMVSEFWRCLVMARNFLDDIVRNRYLVFAVSVKIISKREACRDSVLEVGEYELADLLR